MREDCSAWLELLKSIREFAREFNNLKRCKKYY